MHTNLFANEFMDDITANSLVNLVHMDNIKVIITDLFLLMYENKAFERDTQRLTKNIINDYLESDLCKKQFAALVTEQALQNTEHVVRPPLE